MNDWPVVRLQRDTETETSLTMSCVDRGKPTIYLARVVELSWDRQIWRTFWYLVLISQNSYEHIEPEFSEQQSATPFMKHLSSVRDLTKLEDILRDLVLESLGQHSVWLSEDSRNGKKLKEYRELKEVTTGERGERKERAWGHERGRYDRNDFYGRETDKWRDHEREVNAHVEAFGRKKRLREAKEREDLPRDMSKESGNNKHA